MPPTPHTQFPNLPQTATQVAMYFSCQPNVENESPWWALMTPLPQQCLCEEPCFSASMLKTNPLFPLHRVAPGRALLIKQLLGNLWPPHTRFSPLCFDPALFRLAQKGRSCHRNPGGGGRGLACAEHMMHVTTPVFYKEIYSGACLALEAWLFWKRERKREEKTQGMDWNGVSQANAVSGHAFPQARKIKAMWRTFVTCKKNCQKIERIHRHSSPLK